MSKIRINDLARELERKSREILEVLNEMGMGAGKTHSSSLEADEAEKVRGYFGGDRGAGHGSAAASRAGQTIAPKIDLSHISKPGDVMKAILAKKKEAEEEARHAHAPARPPVPVPPAQKVAAPVAAPAA
ncbi:MAG: translation initiation factor IF-2 N-terminal domain-containing protein, partial [Terracidiphilus sp.]